MEKPSKDLVVDADAHVVESARTWEFMDSSEKQFKPIPLETREESGVKLQFWLIDGKVRGLRFPAFSPAELTRRAQQVGRKFADSQESRELGNVDLRIEYMDRNDIDVQILHNTDIHRALHRACGGGRGSVQKLEPLARRYLAAGEGTTTLGVYAADAQRDGCSGSNSLVKRKRRGGGVPAAGGR